MTSDKLTSTVDRFYAAFEAADLNRLSQIVTEDAGDARKPFAHDWVHLFRFRGERIQLLKEYLDASKVSTALAP